MDSLIRNLSIILAILYNETDEVGLLAVRNNDINIYPKVGSVIAGVWTNSEIKYALSNGYKLVELLESIVFEPAPYNPFVIIVPKLYEKRMDETDPLNRYLYKSIMNHSFGKFAQHKYGQQICIDSINNALEREKNGWKAIKAIDFDYFFQKDGNKSTPKPYFCPILFALITGQSRVIMHQHLKNIGYERILHIDTDGVLFEGNLADVKQIPISAKLGDFKVVKQNSKCSVYGRKMYEIDDDVTTAGGHGLNKENDTLIRRRMKSFKNSMDYEDIGEFSETETPLSEVINRQKEILNITHNQKVFIDDKIYEIEKVSAYIKKWVKTKGGN